MGKSVLFDEIADEKDSDNDRDNPVSMVGEGHVEVEDQSGRFVPILNDNINAMKRDDFCSEIFIEG